MPESRTSVARRDPDVRRVAAADVAAGPCSASIRKATAPNRRYLSADPARCAERVAGWRSDAGAPARRPRRGPGIPSRSEQSPPVMPAGGARAAARSRHGIAWYSLQRGTARTRSQRCPPRASLRLLDERNDFDGKAALVSALDLVSACARSTAHLAGALGRPTWMMLAHVPDWRWGIDGDTTGVVSDGTAVPPARTGRLGRASSRASARRSTRNWRSHDDLAASAVAQRSLPLRQRQTLQALSRQRRAAGGRRMSRPIPRSARSNAARAAIRAGQHADAVAIARRRGVEQRDDPAALRLLGEASAPVRRGTLACVLAARARRRTR